ncbi:MAG: RNA polymerase sigma factor [Acidobacteriia bacterium]|nr:RNA polymerase sigma factor [Terriglobia bacterium]
MSAEKIENLVALGSFEATALPHMKDLYRAASSILRNQTEAEDVVQETFLQAWKSFHRFETGTNCRAWLFKIMFHVIDHHRRKWYRLNLVKDEDINLEELLVYEPPVAEDISDADVLAAFKEIPQQYREVVLLSDVYEFSYKEIQETLGIPAGTVMSRLSRGRQMLRSQLTKFTPPSCPPLSMAQAL